MKLLSGGERNRLLLARLFARPANVLVLDEPTNDLDIETLELLEELIGGFDGTVLLVSHDRVFLDNIVTSTLAFEGDGGVTEYVGGYEDFSATARKSGFGIRACRAELRRTERRRADSTPVAPPLPTSPRPRALRPGSARRRCCERRGASDGEAR